MSETSNTKLEFVRGQIAAIRQWLSNNPPGVTAIAREGFSASYNRKQAFDELKYWEDEEKKLIGTKQPAVRNIDLSQSWE
jgi:hypothetical protein